MPPTQLAARLIPAGTIVEQQLASWLPQGDKLHGRIHALEEGFISSAPIATSIPSTSS